MYRRNKKTRAERKLKMRIIINNLEPTILTNKGKETVIYFPVIVYAISRNIISRGADKDIGVFGKIQLALQYLKEQTAKR